MLRGSGRAVALALLVTLAGCAGRAAGPSPEQGNEGISKDSFRQAQGELRQAIQAQSERIRTLESRLAELDQEPEDGGRLKEVRQRLHRLEGATEVNGHELDRLAGKLTELFDRVDRRLTRVEERLTRLARTQGGGREQEAGSSGADSGASPAEGAERASPEPSRPPDQRRYEAAFDKLRNEEYGAAVTAFRDFLAELPDSRFADNAQYWLGEAYYAQRQYEQALEAFRRVGERYPESDKAPDALLKRGFAYYELEDFRRARQTLTRVTEAYPDHRVGRLARQRLEQIRQEQL